MRTYLIFAFCIATSIAAGLIGSLSTTSAIGGWYTTIVKPSFNPPNWVFGPVWSVLYVCMGVSAALVWVKAGKRAAFALMFFFLHLVINALWSIAFFGLHSPMLALWIIGILWLMILTLIVLFRSFSNSAALLLIPYLLWVSFASVLNAAIVILN